MLRRNLHLCGIRKSSFQIRTSTQMFRLDTPFGQINNIIKYILQQYNVPI